MIRSIAIDDEPLALLQLARFAKRIPDVELVGSYYSVADAKKAIDGGDIDLIFLDIEMPDCNGVEFARQLGDTCPYIIFTTAYPEFAIDGFRLDAVDYLLKPLSFEEMVEAVSKVKRRMSVEDENEAPAIHVKASGKMHRVVISDIMYIKGLSEYVQLFVRGETMPITTFDSIKRLETELGPHSFMRIHKSYLVNLRAITAANRQSVTIGADDIPVGEKYRASFVNYLKNIK